MTAPMIEGSSTDAPIWKLIDRHATLARLAQDESLFGELVVFFLDDHGEIIASLTDAISRADASAVERTAHSLKGMAANLGAVAVAQAAGELEAMGRNRDLSEGVLKEQALQAELNRLVSALQDYRASRESA
ncbi:MAG: Hpt domain-containing protein [Planctomycetes bacterium]|nr:Hpt domain-containing protein [Planctomycetota bacterium]